MIKGEMEIDKLQPNLAKAIEYFDAVAAGNRYNIRASLHKIECLLELNKLQGRLNDIDLKEQQGIKLSRN